MDKHPLADWRNRHDRSQDQFAADLNISRWTVNAIEKGRRNPSLDLAKRIEAKTGISRQKLLPDLYEAMQ